LTQQQEPLLETFYIFCTNYSDFTLVLQQIAKHLELARKSNIFPPAQLNAKVRRNNSRRAGDVHDGTASYCILGSDKLAGQGNRHKYTSAATQIRDSEKATATVQSQ
jgi:hypothetical protein